MRVFPLCALFVLLMSECLAGTAYDRVHVGGLPSHISQMTQGAP